MTYKIVENDVRLLRRILVASNLGDDKSAKKVEDYLRKKGLNFKLPSEQEPMEAIAFMNRLPENERWLATQYGCVLLPDYSDCIFLNSKWMNPFTLYVRLVEPVLELGALGAIHWLPGDVSEEDFRAAAERAHQFYQARETVEEPWYRRIFGR